MRKPAHQDGAMSRWSPLNEEELVQLCGSGLSIHKQMGRANCQPWPQDNETQTHKCQMDGPRSSARHEVALGPK